MTISQAGFVAIVGRPNAGKSTLLNALSQEHLAMVSRKANATRKRLNSIVLYQNAQIIFVDTPGIHYQEKLLNQFMLKEALKAMGDCDLLLFLAPITDNVNLYQDFLKLSEGKKHILLLTKIDTIPSKHLLEYISRYMPYQNCYQALIPITSKQKNYNVIFEEIIKHIPKSPALFDEEIITTEHTRTLYKEMIREALFEFTSDEVPYQSDVLINQFSEKIQIDIIKATIITHTESQKALIIGKNGSNIKKISTKSRLMIEQFGQKKVFLEIFVKTSKGWSNKKEKLKQFGYNIDEY